MKFQTNYPIYLQIADDIKRKIVVGELHPGDKLPSNIDLALQYEVNPDRLFNTLTAKFHGLRNSCNSKCVCMIL